jgi:uncharacterized protein (DUF983 family)
MTWTARRDGVNVWYQARHLRDGPSTIEPVSHASIPSDPDPSDPRHRVRPRGLRSAGRLLGRAATRRCPWCGCREVFYGYLRQRRSCPACGLLLDRGEPDFFIGAYMLNLIVAELLVVAGGVAVAVATWPNVPWTALMVGLAGLIVVAPLVLYPQSRQLWLGLDLLFRPPEQADFEPEQPGVDRVRPVAPHLPGAPRSPQTPP